MRDVQRRFSATPKGETAAIVSAYADEVRDDYIRDVAFAKIKKDPVSLTPGFDKLSDIQNLGRVSGLSTFLCNKDFSFYMDAKTERVSSMLQPVYKTIGIQVSDIRLRKTAMDGSVSYEPLFNPSDIKYIRGDRSDFNLIYKMFNKIIIIPTYNYNRNICTIFCSIKSFFFYIIKIIIYTI